MFEYLALPITLLSILLVIRKNIKFTFIITLIIIALATFQLLFTFYQINTNNIYRNNFENYIYIIFLLSFIISLGYFILQKNPNFKEIGIISIYFIVCVGIVFADNYLSLIIFWELSALLGAFVILQSESNAAKKVALKYFVIHTFGGILLIIGIANYVSYNENYTIINSLSLPLDNYLGYLLLLGILMNLGLPPFSSWLIDGYSKCSANASMLLSIFTTKSALAILFKLYYGNVTLIYFGIALALYGLIFSLIQTNLRKILSFTIIHQLGIGVIAIASLGYTSSSFYSIFIATDILYKLALFMVIVALLKYLKTENIYELNKKININSILGITIIFASIQSLGLPFSAGFISKSFVTSNIHLLHNSNINYIILFLFAGNALNIGIRIPYYLINFKNTSGKIPLENKYQIIPLLLIMISLQAIFFLNISDYMSLYNIISFSKVFILGIILFITANYLTRGKEENLNLAFMQLSKFIQHLSIKTLNLTTKETINKIIVSSSKLLDNKLSNIRYHHHLYVSSMIMSLLILIIIIYFLL